jgi:hypothetical protein
MVTGTDSPPGFARSRSTIAAEASTPSTLIPRAAGGSATRPVPMASSSTLPSPARPKANQPQDTLTRRDASAAPAGERNRIFRALPLMHLRESLVRTESAIRIVLPEIFGQRRRVH